MIPERMLELIILSIVRSKLRYDFEALTEKQYDNTMITERWTNLMEEFLEPYVIESTSKE